MKKVAKKPAESPLPEGLLFGNVPACNRAVFAAGNKSIFVNKRNIRDVVAMGTSIGVQTHKNLRSPGIPNCNVTIKSTKSN